MAALDLLVIGGGPAGLAAAIAARERGGARVIVADREQELGGIPRHADHIGFGLRDLHRLLSGPAYARTYVDLASRAGVTLRPGTTVTPAATPGSFSLTSPAGIDDVSARAVIVATGCRERPRSARLVPGDRPSGIYTTGALQQLVYLQHLRMTGRAVIVGAEHVSFSALLTLVHGGAQPIAMLTEHPRHQTYAPYKWISASRHRVPILTRHRITSIVGHSSLQAIEVEDLRTGRQRTIQCEILVCSGDWIPDYELAQRLGIDIDPVSRAPRVDARLRTSTRAVFAAGNLVHPVETADVAALTGRRAGQAALHFLEHGDWRARALAIECEPPVTWISPGVVSFDPHVTARQHFTWRVERVCTRATVRLEQDGNVLWAERFRALIPTLPLRLPAECTRSVDPAGSAPTLRLHTGAP